MNYDYEIAISYAGEDRQYAEKLASILSKKGVRLFYDQYEKSSLWGKNLYQHLQKIYKEKALFCVIFLSKYYANKLWTKHELEQAQARAYKENREYILPIKIDDTEIPGINETIGYIDINTISIEKIANLLLEKLTIYSSEDSIYEFRAINNKINVYLTDVLGSRVIYTKESKLLFIKDNSETYIDVITADGYADFFTVRPGKIISKKHESGVYKIESNFGKKFNKGDEVIYNFKCELINSFLNDKEYLIQRQHYPSDNVKIIIHFPKERIYKKFVGLITIGAYEKVHTVQPIEIIIDNNPCLSWEIIGPSIKDIYRIEWEW